MGYVYNPLLGAGLDQTGAGGGGGTPGGSTTQIQFNDAGSFGGDADLTWDKTTNVLTAKGDINLDDGAAGFVTTLQTITPTANRTVSIPDATGTLALVAGSSGQLLWNNAGANAGASTLTYDGSILTTSGRFINSYSSGSLAPAKAFTGTWSTGFGTTNTKPHVLIEPTGTTSTAWSTSGTGFGVNAASGFAGNLLDLQVNGTSKVTFTPTGSYILSTIGGASLALGSTAFSDRFGITSGANSVTVSFANVHVTNDASDILAQRRGTNAQVFRVYNTYTSSTNYELGKLEWSSNVFRIGTEKGSGGGTARALEFQTDGTTRLTIGTNGTVSGPNGYNGFNPNGHVFAEQNASFTWTDTGQRARIYSPADGVIRLANNAGSDFNRIQLGGTTSSFPALKRNSAVLETKLADDSAYAQHAASVFQAATAHTVATLPATPTVGMIARVTDATAPAVGVTVAGGGAAAALVWYNGTNWTVIGV